ncbi:ABC transporter ATP-binding protein [Arthrobacter sp. MI7-26]|uniref:dipeptide ABC transporter ATP-binding protein n=1 Tax=Arthrobacter sp. MI7-26 TaxID=2993653 RepID=UPI0022496FEC|nr:ABC transporter ATP-binding protein [Arthrobacter sp. MI7-26]MCX2747874.1 ABC transporter ATP-binding protein [Arthrobacter sp. MI7-26]
MSLLEISGLTLDLPSEPSCRLLDGISLNVGAGETVGIVGESGSGKSLTARTVLGLLPGGARTSGSVLLDGTDMLRCPPSVALDRRRDTVSMIFQDPRSGMNPVRRIGDFLTESLRLCEGWSKADADERALELLRSVGLPRPESHLSQYPHELSGGMLQRVMIAGALTAAPALLVCDEPTAALDVTTQAEIINVLRKQQETRGMGMLFITHDLNLAAALCDRVYVIHSGRIVEYGSALSIFTSPRADYTKRLVAATPTIPSVSGRRSSAAASHGRAPSAGSAEPALEARGVSKCYAIRGGADIRAVDDVSFRVPPGGALALVGESGSGKSTLARMLVGLERPDSGDILVDGVSRSTRPRSRAERLKRARAVQIVFQDPYLSLDPRIPAGAAIEDALRLHSTLRGVEARARVLTLLDRVGLTEKHSQSKPRTLSGGQRQRVAIARALAAAPGVLVLDESTSALDVSVQAQVLDLIDEIRRERGLTLVFVSHDLAVVRRVCETTAVMKQGAVVESGATAGLLEHPGHPYTQLLIDSIPKPRRSLHAISQ